MLLHLQQNDFKNFIINMSNLTNIDADIIEKDYYVCSILKELSIKQNYLKAYFKGGTAIYKILETMNRFSEDIDLTVKVIPSQSNTQNKKRLKLSATGYTIEGLTLSKDKCIDNKGSVTAIYNYTPIINIEDFPLQRAGHIQVESTSFTVSEPTEKYIIQPIIYKFANKTQQSILREKFNIYPFEIETIKLERMFIDKLFATEFYYIRNMYVDTAKHLYDVSILFNNQKIQKLLNDKKELLKLISYKRQEENFRIGGISQHILIKDFSYFKLNFNNDLITAFGNMQNKYVLNNKYKISINNTINILKSLQPFLNI